MKRPVASWRETMAGGAGAAARVGTDEDEAEDEAEDEDGRVGVVAGPVMVEASPEGDWSRAEAR